MADKHTQRGSKPTNTKSLPRVYVLGLKRRGESHYHLTTWLGDLPTFRALYNKDPQYWKASVKVKPVVIAPYAPGYEIDESVPHTHDGFGWAAHPDGKLLSQDEATELVATYPNTIDDLLKSAQNAHQEGSK